MTKEENVVKEIGKWKKRNEMEMKDDKKKEWRVDRSNRKVKDDAFRKTGEEKRRRGVYIGECDYR